MSNIPKIIVKVDKLSNYSAFCLCEVISTGLWLNKSKRLFNILLSIEGKSIKVRSIENSIKYNRKIDKSLGKYTKSDATNNALAILRFSIWRIIFKLLDSISVFSISTHLYLYPYSTTVLPGERNNVGKC